MWAPRLLGTSVEPALTHHYNYSELHLLPFCTVHSKALGKCLTSARESAPDTMQSQNKHYCSIPPPAQTSTPSLPLLQHVLSTINYAIHYTPHALFTARQKWCMIEDGMECVLTRFISFMLLVDPQRHQTKRGSRSKLWDFGTGMWKFHERKAANSDMDTKSSWLEIKIWGTDLSQHEPDINGTHALSQEVSPVP